MTPIDPLERTQLDPLVHGVNNRHLEIGEARHPMYPDKRISFGQSQFPLFDSNCGVRIASAL
jgi:hypothetical protein